MKIVQEERRTSPIKSSVRRRSRMDTYMTSSTVKESEIGLADTLFKELV
jgi:hypothetical protein